MRDRLLPLTLTASLFLACTPAANMASPGNVPSPGNTASPVDSASPGVARVPGVQLADLAQAPRTVESVRNGRVALVNLWATWCDACEKEMPALNRLDERATGDQAVVIGVAVGEPAAKVQGYVEKHGLHYTQLVDEGFLLTDALGSKRLPTTLVVNRRGEVVYVGGALDKDTLAAFRAALEGP